MQEVTSGLPSLRRSVTLSLCLIDRHMTQTLTGAEAFLTSSLGKGSEFRHEKEGNFMYPLTFVSQQIYIRSTREKARN
jgi:hypothetical protein